MIGHAKPGLTEITPHRCHPAVKFCCFRRRALPFHSPAQSLPVLPVVKSSQADNGRCRPAQQFSHQINQPCIHIIPIDERLDL